MLQALILELGCLPSVAAGKFSIPQLPGTLRQAKLLLKSHAFINVRDYLAVREQGQAALQRVMHPNRKSLIREVRKGKRVPVQEVKNAGLNVLLVNTRFWTILVVVACCCALILPWTWTPEHLCTYDATDLCLSSLVVIT
jgi:hypothetical protein